MSNIFVWHEIEELKKEINRHNDLYYKKNSPEISDYDYDLLLKKLEKLEKQFPEFKEEDSPTQIVNDIVVSEKSISHKIRMYSLDNTYSLEEVYTSIQKITAFSKKDELDIVGELKIDGLSINLYYEHGVLQYATTRGDGFVGDNVTENVKQIKSIPQMIPYKNPIEIRGEVYLPHQEFERINKEKNSAGEKLFANPRNAAAGTLKVKDSSIVAKRNLDAFIYSVGLFNNENVASQIELFSFFKQLGFNTNPNYQLLKTKEDIEQYCNFWDRERSNLQYEIDGIVLKVNRFDNQLRLGYTAKAPKWAFSYKFKAEEKQTKLLGVTFQIGRTGAITPVAHLDPIFISGSTVSRATLHNEDQINMLDLHKGDTIKIIKSGEIIPKIIEVLPSMRKENAEKIFYPTKCPSCGSELKKEGSITFCNNIQCQAQIHRRIEHFCSRDAMNIEGLGEALTLQLVEKGLISKIDDIYNLDYDKILTFDKQAKKSVENLRASIENSKNASLDKLIFGLGIRFVGAKTSRMLANHFKTMDKFIASTKEALLDMEEIGEKIAHSIRQFFDNENNLNTIQALKEHGLKMEMDIVEQNNKSLEGLSFLVTGTLQNFSRKQAKEAIENAGGRTVSAVSKKLNYLVVGEKPGSKVKKAEAIPSIKIINEQEFITLLG